MTTAEFEKKEEYTKGYKELESIWKKNDHELLLVGRLAYWTFWLSKLAEKESVENKGKLFDLKREGLQLLCKSSYTSIRKYVPEFHKKLCYSHTGNLINSHLNVHKYIKVHIDKLNSCEKCMNGKEHYYSLYSIGVFDTKIHRKQTKPSFVLYTPYLKLQEKLPPLESLKSVKKYFGKETGMIRKEKKVNNVEINAFDKNEIIESYLKSYNEFAQLLNEENE